MGQEHDDYTEPDPPLLLDRPGFRRQAWTWGIAILVIAGAVVAVAVLGQKTRIHTLTADTVARAQWLAEGCRNYRDTYPDRGYPATLAELAKSTAGVGPFIEDQWLKDGWGNPFRYALVPNADGELEAYIGGERTYNGRTTLYGAKLTAEGAIVLFGRPAD